MTNLKRALSLVLVLALALSMIVMGTSAAKFSDVSASYSYSTEVQFLSDLGIIAGYPDGSYKPEGIITRAEAAAVIYRMLSGKTSAANYAGSTKFPDVTSAHWASGYINFAVELGVVVGYPDGNFHPDQTLTYGEYVTMLVRALGLDQNKAPSFPFGYIALASVEGINASVDIKAGDACPRGSVAKLTYNSILDATYARMANNIYVTEKPTIAKDILKLKSVEGVLTSTGKYDFTGTSAAGEGKFRLDDVSTSIISSGTYTGTFNVAVSDLGKKAKIWYKEDSTSADGDRVYAVAVEAAKEFSTSHIGMKGYKDAYEMTYVASDVDKTLKLSTDCVFVENNEFLYANTNANDFTDNFYPASQRVWLPIAYKFIDNDQDGKYDFAIRTIYGFGQVSSITSSKLTIEGQSTIDRKNSAGDLYAWNTALSSVENDDYVMYTADGAVTDAAGDFSYLVATPDFGSDLYDDTDSATIYEIAKQTGTVEALVDHDKVMLNGSVYRTMFLGDVADLANITNSTMAASLGDEFEYYALSSFGMIAKAEAVSTTSGKYMLITDIASADIGKDFYISAINENGDENTYTVKYDSDSNFTDAAGDEDSLNYADLLDLLDANNDGSYNAADDGYTFFEYDTNSSGNVTELKNLAAALDTFETGTDGGFNDNNMLLNTDNDETYLFNDSSLTYVAFDSNADGVADEFKVYVGSMPVLNDEDDNGDPSIAEVQAFDIKNSSGTNVVKGMYVFTTAASATTSASSNEDMVGYLRSVATNYADGKYSYKYTIATDGAIDKVYYSKAVATADDLSDVITDEKVIGTGFSNAQVVVFDINADGTISNMEVQSGVNFATANAKDPSNETYYGTSIVTGIDTANKLISVRALTGTSVTEGAKLSGTVIGAGVLEYAATTKTFKYASDVKVYAFDKNSTRQATVTLEGVGSIVRITDTLTAGDVVYPIAFEYDDDKEVITSIIYNYRGYTVS